MGLALRFHPARGLMLPGRYLPASGLRIDPTHPLAHGLQTCILPDGGGGVVDLAKPRVGSGGTAAFGMRGPASRVGWSVAANQTGDLNFTAAPWSVAAIAYLNAVPTGGQNPGVFARQSYTNESSNQGWVIGALASSFYANIYSNNGSASYQITGGTPAVGDWMLGLTTDGSTRTLYVNGASAASSGSGNMAAASCSAVLTSNAGGVADWDHYIGCAWNRALSAAEMLRFYCDPLCFLEPAAGATPLYPLPPAPFAAYRMFEMFPP